MQSGDLPLHEQSNPCLRGIIMDLKTMMMMMMMMSKYGDRAFLVAGPKLWNALPHYFHEEKDTSRFKKNLKTYLFDNSDAFHQCVNIK